MTERALYSKLHDIVLPLESKVGSGINTYKTQVRSGNYMSHETTNPLVVTIGWLIEEERVVQQLLELEAGSINIVQLNTLDFDELVHVQNIRAQERGGFVNQWLVQGEFNLVGVNWHWMVDGEEVMTDWDDITWSAFIAGGGVVTEGNELPDTNCTWKCAIGSWQTPAEYLTCTLDSGFNHCIVVEAWGKDYPATADVIIQADVLNIWDDPSDVGLSIRNQDNGNLVNGSAYGFVMEISTDQFIFHKFTDASYTEVKRWAVWPDKTAITLAYNTYYTLKVVARGNRFDCYCNGRYVGTVFDDTYRVGWHGLVSQAANIRADNFILKHAKPLVAHLPVGAYDWNQIRMSATTRLNDDINACGLSRTVVAPDNPIEFRQWRNQLNDPSVVLDLPLNERMGTTVYDNSGNDNHSTSLTGTATWSKIDKGSNIVPCLNFEFGGYVNIAHASELITPEFSVEWVVNFKILPKKSSYDNMSTKTGSWLIRCTTDASDLSYFEFFLFDGVDMEPRVSGIHGSIVENTTHHLVITFDGDAQRMYLDGALQPDVEVGRPYAPVAAGNLSFGSLSGGTGRTEIYSTEYRVYNRALTTTEIQQKYDQLALNSPSGGEVRVWDTMGSDGDWDYLELHLKCDEGTGTSFYDSSKNNYTITNNTAVGFTSTSYNKWSKSAASDTAGYLHVNRVWDTEIESGIGTICYWMNPSSIVSDLGGFMFYDGVDQNDLVDFYYDVSETHFQLQVKENTVDRGTKEWDYTITTDQWYFIAVVWNGLDVTLYVNGESQGTQSFGTNTWTFNDSMDNLRVWGNWGARLEGYGDDFIYYTTDLSADRIKWLYENMPRTVDESLWKRVYDARHPFVGDMIIDNGIIRLCQDYRTTYGNSITCAIGLMYYSDGIWEEKPVSFVDYLSDNHWIQDSATSTKAFGYQFIIKELGKYKVVIEQHVQKEDEWIDHELYMISGMPFMNIKMANWKLDSNVRVDMVTQDFMISNNTGYDVAPRFALASLDVFGDALIDAVQAQGTETEGLSISFSTQSNVLWLFWAQHSDNGWISYWGAAGTRVAEIFHNVGIDFDADIPPRWWGMGLMPFDTSRLRMDSDNYTAKSGAATIDLDGGCATGNRITLPVQWNYVFHQLGNSRAAGSWRVWIRAKESADNAQVGWGIYNETVGPAYINYGVTSLTSTYTWYFVDVIIPESMVGNDLKLRCHKHDASANEVWIDGMVAVPIDNSKNFPLNARNHALMIPDITEIGG